MIKLYKNSIIYLKHHLRSTNPKKYPLKRLKEFLWEPIWIHPDITLRDIFKIISLDPKFWDTILQEWALPELLKEYAKVQRARKPKKTWVDSIRICRYMEIWDHGTGPELIFDDSVSGTKQGGRIDRSLLFSPLGEILHCKIRIKKDVGLTDWRTENKKHLPKFTEMGKTCFTVLEIFRAIFYELTFAGTPDDRDEQWKELKNRVKDYKSSHSP